MIELSYVQLRDDSPAHDPAAEGPPTLDTRRTSFASGDYTLRLSDTGATVLIVHRESLRGTYVPFAACRFALALGSVAP